MRTRTVPVPGSGEQNVHGAGTERFRYPSDIVELEFRGEIDRSVRLIVSHTHTDSDEYSIVPFCKNATIIIIFKI